MDLKTGMQMPMAKTSKTGLKKHRRRKNAVKPKQALKRKKVRRLLSSKSSKSAAWKKKKLKAKTKFKRKLRRKRYKKTILIMDHFVPHFDKDTGSRTMYQYMKLLNEMGLRVRFAGFDSTRYEPYTSQMEQLGIKVLNGEIHSLSSWLARHGKRVAYAYINRPHVGQQFMSLVRQYTRAKIIYNSVDFGYLRELRRADIEHNPLAQSHAEELKQQEFGLFGQSDVVYTVSEYEKTILEAEMPGKRVVAIPTFFYEPPFPLGPGIPPEERADITFVGGFNHSPNSDGVFWFVREVLPLIAEQIPGVRFQVIGSNPSPEILALRSESITVTGYIPDEELERCYGHTKVVVAPLRYGAGVKGKVIEAVAHGIPVVTTSIGIEGIKDCAEIIAVGDTPQAFASQVVDLYRNPDRWLRIREMQTEYSNRYLTTDYAKQVLSEDIRP